MIVARWKILLWINRRGNKNLYLRLPNWSLLFYSIFRGKNLWQATQFWIYNLSYYNLLSIVMNRVYLDSFVALFSVAFLMMSHCLFFDLTDDWCCFSYLINHTNDWSCSFCCLFLDDVSLSLLEWADYWCCFSYLVDYISKWSCSCKVN